MPFPFDNLDALGSSDLRADIGDLAVLTSTETPFIGAPVTG